MRSFLLVLCLMVCFSVSGVAAQSTSRWDALPNCDFSAQLTEDNMIVGAVVYNLRTQQGCAENLDVLFPVASVPKIFVAATFFDWVLTQDAVNFETELTFSERYWMGGRGDCLGGDRLNQRVTLGELSDVMIACSDNAATWMLMDAMGWERVQSYIDATGIEGFGQVIPYSEVDRQKLIAIDPTWEQVPIAMASRFWRSQMTSGLEAYFSATPDYDREARLEGNQTYFDTTTYNTSTPRAMAEYLYMLSQDSYRTDNSGQIARWLFNTMLLTPRQFTAQGIAGTLNVGAKNGFDQGLRAEVNVMFDNLPEKDRNPVAFSVVFVRQPDLLAPNVQSATTREDAPINQFMLRISGDVQAVLFPNYTKPPVSFSRQVSSVSVNPKAIMDACWNPYAERGFLLEYRAQLESCWLNQRQSQTAPGDFIGVGLVLQNLGEQDTRITFMFTDPNGETRSYQTELFFRQSAALYWFHPVPQEDNSIGMWTVDVFINRQLVYTRDVDVQPLF